MTGALGSLVDAPEHEAETGTTPWGVSSFTPMKAVASQKAPGTDDPVAMAHRIGFYR